MEKYSFDRYGDYHFVPYSGKRGQSHGFSYCYFRRGKTYRLLASLDEAPGYTIFSYDSRTAQLRIERDCAGVQHTGGSFPAFSLFFAEGTEDEVFDAWFAALGCRPRTTRRLAGYSSWYNRYQNIDEASIQEDLNGCKTLFRAGDLFQIDDGCPQEKGQIQCSYSTDNVILNEEKTVTATGSTTAFNAGECHTLKINSLIPGPGSLIRPLAPGDFVFQGTDGIEVYPGDGLLTDGKIPEYQQAIGMVITCTADKLTDPKCNENNWNHAYVMALDSIGTGRWGDDNVDEAIDNFNTEVRVDLNMNGYSETETMLEHHADKENFTTVYTALSILVKYRQKDNIPNNSRSPWFIPSIGQWCDMLKNICGKDPMTFSRTSIAFEEFYKYGTETLDKLNAQLGKAGRSARKLHSLAWNAGI